MPEATPLVLAPDIRLRHEYFGALAWRTAPRRIYRLPHEATTLAVLHEQPRAPDDARRAAGALGIGEGTAAALVAELRDHGVLVPSEGRPAAALAEGETQRIAGRLTAHTPTMEVVKPLWVHLQPFTRCNQHCLHCYCSGGPRADPFLLPVEQWHRVIAMLDGYGVFDVYITGGETLLYEEFFALADDILGRGMGFGVSTNATLLSERVLDRLRALRIGTVQVSLDGGDPALHELIRGAPGSFARTLDGMGRIAAFSEPVVNTVVNRLNLDQLDDVVRLGKDRGCRRFKFFPQKPVGRSTAALTLDDNEIMYRLVPECARLADAYGVEIETVDPARPCGSGSIGFAVDQRGDIYPCIFGVENPVQRAGNILTDDLDTVWFTSPVLERFRGEVATPCRRCES